MSGHYRLTLYDKTGLIERMLPFQADNDQEARAFADRERYGRHAVLSNNDGLVEQYIADTLKEAAARLRRRA